LRRLDGGASFLGLADGGYAATLAKNEAAFYIGDNHCFYSGREQSAYSLVVVMDAHREFVAVAEKAIPQCAEIVKCPNLDF
jgi:hypothetical protein